MWPGRGHHLCVCPVPRGADTQGQRGTRQPCFPTGLIPGHRWPEPHRGPPQLSPGSPALRACFKNCGLVGASGCAGKLKRRSPRPGSQTRPRPVAPSPRGPQEPRSSPWGPQAVSCLVPAGKGARVRQSEPHEAQGSGVCAALRRGPRARRGRSASIASDRGGRRIRFSLGLLRVAPGEGQELGRSPGPASPQGSSFDPRLGELIGG